MLVLSCSKYEDVYEFSRSPPGVEAVDPYLLCGAEIMLCFSTTIPGAASMDWQVLVCDTTSRFVSS
jgi:hypothetical protein